MNIEEMGDFEILKELGTRFQRERLNRNISRKELARTTSLASKTIQNLEDGKNSTLLNWIVLLRGLRLLSKLDLFLPEPAWSPLQLAKLRGKERRRASPKKSQEKRPWKWKDNS